MLEGLEDIELEANLNEKPQIVALFEIDVLETVAEYASTSMLQEEEYELDQKSILKLSRAREAFEKEMEISRRVTASEEVNIGTMTDPRLLSIARDLTPREKMTMTELLKEYKDVFAWSHKDMKGLDPKFYQHKINLSTYAKPVLQRRYRMNQITRLRIYIYSPKYLRKVAHSQSQYFHSVFYMLK